jgi:hypothetical protein
MHVVVPRRRAANYMLRRDLRTTGLCFELARWAIPRTGVTKTDSPFERRIACLSAEALLQLIRDLTAAYYVR